MASGAVYLVSFSVTSPAVGVVMATFWPVTSP